MSIHGIIGSPDVHMGNHCSVLQCVASCALAGLGDSLGPLLFEVQRTSATRRGQTELSEPNPRPGAYFCDHHGRPRILLFCGILQRHSWECTRQQDAQ